MTRENQHQCKRCSPLAAEHVFQGCAFLGCALPGAVSEGGCLCVKHLHLLRRSWDTCACNCSVRRVPVRYKAKTLRFTQCPEIQCVRNWQTRHFAIDCKAYESLGVEIAWSLPSWSPKAAKLQELYEQGEAAFLRARGFPHVPLPAFHVRQFTISMHAGTPLRKLCRYFRLPPHL